MNYETAAQFILLLSFLGIAAIASRKIPVLVSLPEVSLQEKKISLFSKLKARLALAGPFKNFSPEIFLQKILTKIRIISLKTDTKTFGWIQKLREKALSKKIYNKDGYWDELKKTAGAGKATQKK